MSARPPATRDAFELLGGLFHLRQDRPPPRGARQRQTRRKPGTQSHEATARRSRAMPVEPPQPMRRVLCFLERHGVGPWRLRKRSEEHTSELQSLAYLVCRLLLEKKKK